MSPVVRWVDDPGEAAGWSGEPLAWIVAPDDPRRSCWLDRAAATAADHADFAARADAGVRIERRRLTRLLLAQATGRHPREMTIGRDPRGAPTVDAPLHLGIAGRGGWAVIAIAADPIGVDIEPTDRLPPVWDMLTGEEAAAVAADPDPARAWLRHWVAKEAHAKRCGDPRRADPATIAIAAATASSPQGDSAIAIRDLGAAIAAAALSSA